jgi:methionyl-tRNA formyltransferase
MDIVFIGGFSRGQKLLDRLLARGERIVAAYVSPEDVHEPVKAAPEILAECRRRGVPATLTRKVGQNEADEIRGSFRPEVIFCSGWRTLFPSQLLGAAPRGVVAAHPSLLPRLRGFAPVNWGLILGHEAVGVTLFQLTEALDDGEVYFQEALPVGPGDRLATVQERLDDLSVLLFEKYLDALHAGSLAPRTQEHACATYACARTPADGEICWDQPSAAIARLIQGLAPPAPGAFTYYDGEQFDVLRAAVLSNPRRYEGRIPGRVVGRDPAEGSVDVLTRDGIVRVFEVRRPGGAAQRASDIITSVRRSLGMEHSQEIDRLRRTVRALEARLAALEQAVCPRESAAA